MLQLRTTSAQLAVYSVGPLVRAPGVRQLDRPDSRLAEIADIAAVWLLRRGPNREPPRLFLDQCRLPSRADS